MLRKGGMPEKDIPFNFLLKRFIQVGKEMIAAGKKKKRRKEKKTRIEKNNRKKNSTK